MIRGLLKYYRAAVLVVIGLIVAGVGTILTMPRTEDPEFEVGDLTVVTLWPGVMASKIEQFVSRPIETAMEELDNIREISSISTAGVSTVVVRMTDDAEPEEVTDKLKQSLRDISDDLPDGTTDPEVFLFNPATLPVTIVSLHAENADYLRLEDLAEELESDIRAIEEVSRTEIQGMPERQIAVLADDRRLSQYGIPLTQLRDVLQAENAGVPGGKLDVGTRRYLLKNPNEYASLDQIRDTVVGSAGSSLIRVRDVAEVRDQFGDPRYVVRTNGETALLITAEKKQRTNTVAVGEDIVAAVDRMRSRLPEGYRLSVVSNQGENVSNMLGTLGSSALGGAVVVIITVTLFLGIRQALVVSVSIPLSVLITFVMMRITNIDLNQMSIFGIILALGMLVDSALVVVENIALNLESGDDLFSAVTKGAEQVRAPVTSSGLTTVAAFVPLLFLAGTTGAFIFAMPMTLMFAMLGSLIVALTVVPLLCYAMWRAFPPKEMHEETGGRMLAIYREVAKLALRNRLVTIALATGAFVFSGWLISYHGVVFFPNAEKSFFLVNVRLPREANLETTDRIVRQIEAVLEAEPAIRDYTTNLGKGSPRVFYNELRQSETPSYAQLFINLNDDFGGTAEDYAAQLKPKLDQITGATIEPKIIQTGPTTGAPIEIRLIGDDLEVLDRLAGEVKDRIADVTGLVDLRDSLGERIPRVVLDLDRQAAGLRGVDTLAFANTVFMAVNGQEATVYRSGEDEIPVVVRLREESLLDVSDLNRLTIPSQSGTMVPFGDLARLQQQQDFAQINRRAGRRLVLVESDVGGGRQVVEVAEDIESRLAGFELPAGYSLEIGGESEAREESFSGLGEAMMMALLLIYGILALQFNSFVQPFVILLTVPFGTIGASIGLFVTGNPFGFMAFIGIVCLTGIIINDSIVLADYANYLQRVEYKGKFESLLEAGERRFRPVILTSVTTSVGMLPLAITGGTFWGPMAWGLIFGLMFATVLILVVMPVIYALLVRTGEGRRAFKILPRVLHALFGGDSPPGREHAS